MSDLFENKLRELMAREKFKYDTELASAIDVDRMTVGRWLKGSHKPKGKSLQKLIDKFPEVQLWGIVPSSTANMVNEPSENYGSTTGLKKYFETHLAEVDRQIQNLMAAQTQARKVLASL